jgi:hypothetical protein
MRFRAIDLEAFCSMFPLTLFMIMIISFVPQIDFYEQQGMGDTGVDDMDHMQPVSSPRERDDKLLTKA